MNIIKILREVIAEDGRRSQGSLRGIHKASLLIMTMLIKEGGGPGLGPVTTILPVLKIPSRLLWRCNMPVDEKSETMKEIGKEIKQLRYTSTISKLLDLVYIK